MNPASKRKPNRRPTRSSNPSRSPARGRERGGITVIEVVISLGLLATATVFVSELAVRALAERGRADRRLDAADAAENVLEAARATPWADLTPTWAAARTLPDHLTPRLPGGKLTAAVEPEPGRPRVKRVTVAVDWTESGRPARPVRLVGLFADRGPEARR